MIRKAVALMTALALVFSLSACGSSNDGVSTLSENKSEAENVPTEPAQAIEQPAESFEEKETQLSDSDLETFAMISEELDNYLEERNFALLFKVYKEYRGKYPMLSDKLEEQKTVYIGEITSLFDEWIGEADSFVLSGDMESANNKINDISKIINMTSHFKELDIYQDILSERNNYYYEYNKAAVPVDLMGSEFDMENGCYYKDETESANPGPYADQVYFIDKYGNVYKKYYELKVGSTNEGRPCPFVVFNADNQYDIFHAKFVCHNLMKEYNAFHIEVYGDDTQLYVSDSFTNYDEPMEISINITGYKLIKLVAIRDDYVFTLVEPRSPSVGLFEASFSHSEIPEFEYYNPQNQE